MPVSEIDKIDRELLNILQSEFPLVEEPFKAIGARLGTEEAEVFTRVRELKKKNIVRQIGAIFDTRRLGYRTALIAMRFPDDRLNAGAKDINRHPGVSHNYARNGHFNLWFTLAVPPGEVLEDTVKSMAARNSATSFRILPTIRFFKIGVNFDMVNEVSNAKEYFVPDEPVAAAAGAAGSANVAPAVRAPAQRSNGVGVTVGDGWNKAQPLSATDVAFIREMQEDIRLVSRPFDAIAARLDMTVPELFAHADDMMARKLMRRYSAVLYHRRAGFSANAMVVWKVPKERSQEVGEILARSPWVTHCYERPTYDDWPYSHYTMIHATTREKCELVAEELVAESGITDRQLLYSSREYKKTRVRYFV
ncbi:MAG: Lrp/AsnC family transcriptional regulator [SAR202 cluster bacterium]|nr:Lrp/AsnC family transcriptional regulator [SAR202 cluster bacterium]